VAPWKRKFGLATPSMFFSQYDSIEAL